MEFKILKGKYQIRTDPYNWILEQKHIIQSGPNEGSVVYKNARYFGDLQSLCQSLLRKPDILEEHEINSLEQAVSRMEEAAILIRNSVEPIHHSLASK